MDLTNVNTALASAMGEELARCGLRHAVISPGSRSTPLAVALWRHPGIEVTVAVDERSGGFFALGAAQSSGAPVALLCTSGTAAANYHPAVAEADLSSVPLIVLTADRPPELRDIGAGQTIDQIKLYGSSVRWFCEMGIHAADDSGLLHFRSSACRAFAAASGDPRPGPVHLNIPFRDPLAPIDVPGSVTAGNPLALGGRPGAPLTTVTGGAPQPSRHDLEVVSKLIDDCERVMIVAGRQRDPSIRKPVAALAEHLNCPILAEPTSQIRCGPHDRTRVISAYDLIAGNAPAELAPDLILRIGEMPTSKALRSWMADIDGLRQVVVDPGYSWYEPLRSADLMLRADTPVLLDQMCDRLAGRSGIDFLDSWLDVEESAQQALETELGQNRLHAGTVHRKLARLQSDGELVYTASSMAVRDQERYLKSRETDLYFLANRGANGIDGLLASGVGAAAASGLPATVITGDLGFQHDVGSLALMSSCSAPVRVVVLNDGGGSIFSRLPQKQAMPPDEFEALMRTPSGLDVEAAAAMFKTPYSKIEDISQLPAALAAGSGVLEIPISR